MFDPPCEQTAHLAPAAHELSLEYRRIDGGPDQPTLVFLHEGLGTAGSWRGLPERLCAATGLPGLVYSRAGYGHSLPLMPVRDISYLHVEALQVLPALLAQLGIARPLLVGHSDGASIALLYASLEPQCAGIVAIAPHVFVETITLAGIRDTVARYRRGGRLHDYLARIHVDADATFSGWGDTWLSEGFAHWNIESLLGGIRCPVLTVQGNADEYATLAQLDRIERAIGTRARCERAVLAGLRHSPHLEAPERVDAALRKFVMSLIGDRKATNG